MYRVPKDKRAKKSMERLYQGLLACLQEKSFGEITVRDITRKSGVSRATYYRLVDHILDILIWRCDQIMDDALSQIKAGKLQTLYASLYYFISAWMVDKPLMKSLTVDMMSAVMFRMYTKYADVARDIIFEDTNYNHEQRTAMSYMAMSILPTFFRIWHENETWTTEQIIDELIRDMDVVVRMLKAPEACGVCEA